MSLPISFLSKTFNDNTMKPNGEAENASVELPITTITVGNYTALHTLIDNLSAAINDLSIGVPAKRVITDKREDLSTARASSTLAQRENKYLMRYHDAVTNQKFRASIPVADLTLLPDGSEFLDMTAGVGAALKTAFEAIVQSPDNVANAVVLDSVQFVGRNT